MSLKFVDRNRVWGGPLDRGRRPVGLARVRRQPDRGSGADEGVRPTTVPEPLGPLQRVDGISRNVHIQRVCSQEQLNALLRTAIGDDDHTTTIRITEADM